MIETILLLAGFACLGLGLVATFYQEGENLDYTPAAAVTAGTPVQLQDGRVGVPANDIDAGRQGAVRVCGVFKVAKSTTVFLDGDEVWYKSSTSIGTYRLNGDFFLGTAVGDAGSSQTWVYVDLNRRPEYAIEFGRTGFVHAVTLTAGVATVANEGGALAIDFDATDEAQRGEALSEDLVSIGDDWIITGEINIESDGNNAALDVNIGVASAGHASDADSIALSAFVHVDGNSANILAESDDATNETAATDTTIDLTEGTYFEFKIDGRDPASLAFYVNGARVLSGTTFDVSDAATTLKVLAHAEKSGGAAVAAVRVKNLKLRKAA